MNFLKVTLLAVIFPLFMTSVHKYYVSVTQLSYVKEKKVIQIISRIDIADFELTLQERYDATIKLTAEDEKPMVDEYVNTFW